MYDISEFEAAIEHYKHAIAIAETYNDTHAKASELGNMGAAFNSLGHYDEARSCIEQSVKIFRQIGSEQALAAQLAHLGNVHRNLKNYQDAEHFLKESISYAEKVDRFGLGTSLGNLALIYNLIGKYEEAIECASEGILISKELGNKQAEASQLSSIGVASSMKRDYVVAESCFLEGIRIAQLIGDKNNECAILINLANVYILNGQSDLALASLSSALDLAEKGGFKDHAYKARLLLMVNSK